jgi:hypothetical protein
MKELTQFQFDVLVQFAGIRAATDRSLARAMRCEMAVIKHAIAMLLRGGLIAIDLQGEITLAPAGVTHLNAKGVAVKKPKDDSLAKLAVLDLPPSNETLQALAEMTGADVQPDFYKAITEGDDQLAFNVRKSGVLNIENGQAKFTPAPEQEPDPEVPTLPGVDQIVFVESTPEGSDKQRSVWNEGTGPGTKPAGQIVFTAPTGDWGQLEALDLPKIKAHLGKRQESTQKFLDPSIGRPFAEVPEPDRPDFTTLVRQGLDRLNKQLGRVDTEIDEIDLKIETLSKLSVSVEKISAETAQILRDVSKDLHRIRYNYTGDDARSSK